MMPEGEVQLLLEHLDLMRRGFGVMATAWALLFALMIVLLWFVINTHTSQNKLRKLLERLDENGKEPQDD